MKTRTNEGFSASVLGSTLIALNLCGAFIFFLVFGFESVPDGYSKTKEVMVPGMVGLSLVLALNGWYFGYVLQKIGSVLGRVEKLLEYADPDSDFNKAKAAPNLANAAPPLPPADAE